MGAVRTSAPIVFVNCLDSIKFHLYNVENITYKAVSRQKMKSSTHSLKFLTRTLIKILTAGVALARMQ